MEVLYFFESIRNPVLDFLFSVITLCGEETVFMAIGMIFFWCINKYEGYYLLSVGFIGTLINQFLKMLFRVPRPWLKDPSFTIVESAREAASGYSFPSGHTQTSVGLFGGIARISKQKALRIVAIALCILVPISRMYLGVHTPTDVIVSTFIALALVFLLRPLFLKAEKSPKLMLCIFCSLFALSSAYLLFIGTHQFPSDAYLPANVPNLISAKENGFTLIGCMAGLVVVYVVDTLWINFDTKAPLLAQVLKVVGGLIVVVAAKELLRFPLNALFGEQIGRALRYFTMVILAGTVWPLTFKFFSKLCKKK